MISPPISYFPSPIPLFMKNFLKFLAFLSGGLIILYLVYQNQEAAYAAKCAVEGIPAEECSLVQKVLSDFRTANYSWILVVLLCFVISNVSRAIRWNMLIRPLGYNPTFYNSFFAIALNYFANLGLPRAGEFVRAGTMAQYENIPLQKVFGTVVTDRIMDVICMLLILGLAFLLEFDKLSQAIQSGTSSGDAGAEDGISLLQILGVLAVLGLIGLGILYAIWDRIKDIGIVVKIRMILLGFWEGIQTIANLEKPWLFILHTINIWVMYYLMSYLSFFAYEPTSTLPPVAGLSTFAFGTLGIVIPTPGGMGSFQYLVGKALEMYGISAADAFSFSNILFFSVQIGVSVFTGILALIFLPILNKGRKVGPSRREEKGEGKTEKEAV